MLLIRLPGQLTPQLDKQAPASSGGRGRWAWGGQQKRVQRSHAAIETRFRAERQRGRGACVCAMCPGAGGVQWQGIKERRQLSSPGPELGRGEGVENIRNTPADEFLSREVDREQRISCFACANPRRGQTGTGLRSRSRPLPGRGSGRPRRGPPTRAECGRGRWERNARLPSSSRASGPKAPFGAALFRPRGRGGLTKGQGRAQGAESLGVRHLGASRVGVGGCATPERVAALSRVPPSSPRLPSHLRPGILGPRGLARGRGEGARPYLGGAEPRAHCVPRAAFRSIPGGPAGARLINAKALLLFFVPGIPLSRSWRAGPACSQRSGAHPLPAPTDLLCGVHGLL